MGTAVKPAVTTAFTAICETSLLLSIRTRMPAHPTWGATRPCAAGSHVLDALQAFAFDPLWFSSSRKGCLP